MCVGNSLTSNGNKFFYSLDVSLTNEMGQKQNLQKYFEVAELRPIYGNSNNKVS